MSDDAWQRELIARAAAGLGGHIAACADIGPPKTPQRQAELSSRLLLAALADMGCDPHRSREAIGQALADWCAQRGVAPPDLGPRARPGRAPLHPAPDVAAEARPPSRPPRRRKASGRRRGNRRDPGRDRAAGVAPAVVPAQAVSARDR